MNWFVYHCSVILSYFVSGTATINPWFKITMPRFQPSGGLTDHFVSQKKRRDQALPFTRRSAAKIIHDDVINCSCVTAQERLPEEIENVAFQEVRLLFH